MGYLHEFIGCQTKQSLVYDLQEPFRWIADVAVMEAFESRLLDLPDFYFTGDDYRYRFDPVAKQRFLNLLRERFNSGVRYKGRTLKWATIIEMKAVELGRYLAGRSNEINFSQPHLELKRTDSLESRRRILSLSQAHARKLGIGKGTLHYLRGSARDASHFEIYHKVAAKLGAGAELSVQS